jgi:putative endonuclease
MERAYHVYILASRRNGTLYVGVTGNLSRRIWEHREGLVEGFTKTYGVRHLVWYEQFSEINAAITFEKRLKRWKRDWKVTLLRHPIRNGSTGMRR